MDPLSASDCDTSDEPAKHDVDMYPEPPDSPASPLFQLNQFNFNAQSSNFTAEDGLFEEIAPDAHVVSSSDLVNLVSQFRSTNIRPHHPSPPIPSPPTRSPYSTLAADSIPPRPAPRRQVTRTSSHNDRHLSRNSLARLQTRLEAIANDENRRDSKQLEYAHESTAAACLPPTNMARRPSIRAVLEDYTNNDVTNPLRGMANYRRSSSIKPRDGYVRKTIKLRNAGPMRNPLVKRPSVTTGR